MSVSKSRDKLGASAALDDDEMGVDEDGGAVLLQSLEPSKVYQFNVRAHNSSGYGSSSNKSVAVRPLAIPGKPTDVKASATHEFMMITWTPAPLTPNTSAATSFRFDIAHYMSRVVVGV
jgi:hypothetical protein